MDRGFAKRNGRLEVVIWRGWKAGMTSQTQRGCSYLFRRQSVCPSYLCTTRPHVLVREAQSSTPTSEHSGVRLVNAQRRECSMPAQSGGSSGCLFWTTVTPGRGIDLTSSSQALAEEMIGPAALRAHRVERHNIWNLILRIVACSYSYFCWAFYGLETSSVVYLDFRLLRPCRGVRCLTLPCLCEAICPQP